MLLTEEALRSVNEVLQLVQHFNFVLFFLRTRHELLKSLVILVLFVWTSPQEALSPFEIRAFSTVAIEHARLHLKRVLRTLEEWGVRLPREVFS